MLGSCPFVVTVMGGDILFNERDRRFIDKKSTKIILKASDFITAKSYFLIDETKKLVRLRYEPARIL